MRKTWMGLALLAAPAAALVAYGMMDAASDRAEPRSGSDADGQANTAADGLSALPSEGAPRTWRVRRISAAFDQPLYLAPVPDGTGRVYVVEKGGLIRILDPATGGINPTPFLDVSAEISTDGAQGLLGFATAPDFAASRLIYVYLINNDGDSEIRRYRARSSNPDRVAEGSVNTILTFTQPGATNHKGGWLGFGLDDHLYLASGDGGPGEDPNNTSQDTSLLLGKIIRIDPDGDDFPGDPLRDYVIPPDNPFAGGGGRPEIWAYGLRNPFRASFDRVTGQFFIGDVGQREREEINFMRPQDGGANFGWSIFEGNRRFKPGNASGLIAPSIEYLHGTQPRQGDSVTGGYVYRGPVAELRGLYFFADFVRGNIWTVEAAQFQHGVTLPRTAFRNRNAQFLPDVGTIDRIASFGEDEAGNLFIVGIDGEIFMVQAKSV